MKQEPECKLWERLQLTSDLDTPKTLIILGEVKKWIQAEFFQIFRKENETEDWFVWEEYRWKLSLERTAKAEFNKWLEGHYGDLAKRDTIAELNAFKKEYFSIASEMCILVPIFKDSTPGTSYKNGYFVEKGMMFIDHDKDEKILYGLDFNYPQKFTVDDLPNNELFEVLSLFFTDYRSLALFRNLGYRCLIQKTELNTGVYLHGEPGTGKSLIGKFLSDLVGQSASCSLTVTEILVSFNRGTYKYTNLLVINEATNLNNSGANMLAQHLGRDYVPYTTKNVTGTFSFQFKGTVLIISNHKPYRIFRNYPALVDRFFTIETKPRAGVPRSDLAMILNKYKHALVHWFSTQPRVVNASFVRTAAANQELYDLSIDIPTFARDCLVYDSNSDTILWFEDVEPVLGDFIRERITNRNRQLLFDEIVSSVNCSNNLTENEQVKKVRKLDTKDNKKKYGISRLRFFTDRELEIRASKASAKLPYDILLGTSPFDIDKNHPAYAVSEQWEKTIEKSKTLFKPTTLNTPTNITNNVGDTNSTKVKFQINA